MRITYKKLWKLLIDREMMKKDLLESSKISTVSMATRKEPKCHYRCFA